MRVRKQSPSGDMTFGSGKINFYIDSPDGVAQAVMTRLMLWSGEWYLNVEEGTPYQIGALGKGTMQTVDPMLRERILGTQGVLSIVDYSSRFDADARKFYVTCTINTIYGVTTVQGVL